MGPQKPPPLKEVNQALICFVLIVSDKGLSFQHEWTDEDQKLQLPGAQSGEAQPPQACGPRQCSEVLPGQHDGPGIHQEDGRYPLLIPDHTGYTCKVFYHYEPLNASLDCLFERIPCYSDYTEKVFHQYE